MDKIFLQLEVTVQMIVDSPFGKQLWTAENDKEVDVLVENLKPKIIAALQPLASPGFHIGVQEVKRTKFST